MLTTLESETPQPLDVAEAFLNLQHPWRPHHRSYPIGTTATTSRGRWRRRFLPYVRARRNGWPGACAASALMGPSSEGRTPGAAEDMRPGRLPKVPCQSWGDSRTAGRGISPLGGEGRGKSTTPLPERRTRQ